MTWLYQLQHPTRPAPCYLFGTMHTSDRATFTDWPQVQRAIDGCDAFAAEFDLDEMPAAGALSPAHFSPGGLERHLTARQLDKLRLMVRKATGVDILPYRHLPPVFIAQLLTSYLKEEEEPFEMDRFLYDYARDAGKPTYGLETMAAQLEIIGQIPERGQVQSLRRLGQKINTYRRQLQTNIRQYERGDIRALHRSVKGQLGPLRRLLLYDRNYRMTERFTEIAGDQTLFAAVGAGHLWGGKGMLRLLSRTGYRVRQMPSPESQ